MPVEIKEIKQIAETDFNSIFEMDANSFFNDFNKSGSESVSTLTQFCKRFDEMDDTMRSYLTDCMQKQVPASFDGYNKYVQSAINSNKQLTASSKAAKIGMQALATVGNMFLGMAISWGVSKIFEGIDNLIHAEEKAAEKLEEMIQLGEEAKNAIDDINSEYESTASTVDKVAERYARLAQEVGSLNQIGQNQGTLSNDEYTEFLDISNQLSELFPTLTKGYDENGNALLDLSGNVSAITNELYRFVEAEKEVASIEMQEKMDDLYNSTSSKNSNYSVDWEKENNKIKALNDTYNRIMDSYNNGVDYSSYLNLTEGGEVFDALTKDLDILNNYYKAVGDEYSQYSSVYDFSTLTENDIKALKESYNILYKEYLLERDYLTDKINAENKDFGKYVVQSLQGSSLFDGLTENQQNIINNIFTNLGYDTLLPDYEDWDDFYENYISEVVIKSIKNIDNEEIETVLVDALNNNFTTSTLNELLNSLIGEYGFTEDNPLILYLQTKLVERTSEDNIIKNQLGFNKNASNTTDARHNQEVNNFINSLSDEERTIWLNSDIPEDVLKGNIEDWEAHLDELQNIADDSLLDPFESLLSSSTYKDTRDKLVELSQLDLLDEDAISDLEGYNELLEVCGGEIDTLIEKVKEYAETSGTAFGSVNDLTTIKGGLDSLEGAYADKFDGDNFVSSDLLSGLYEQFGHLDVFDDFINTMMDVKSTAEETQQAFDDLATAYIDSEYNMANLTDANRDYVIAQLEKLNVSNAEEAVDERLRIANTQRANAYNQLTTSAKALSEAKKLNVESGDDLVNLTWEEITALANEVEAANQDASYLRGLALAKQGVNATTINTTTDVAELVNMAKAAGFSAAYIRILENAKHIGDASSQAEAIATIKSEIMNALSDFSINYTPFTYTPTTGGGGGGGGDSTPEEAEATVETIDWIEIAIERLEYQINQLDKTVGNVYTNWTDRNAALTDEISKVKDEIALQEQAYYAYLGKANSIGLSEEYKQKVQNGTIEIEDIEDETLRQQISDYQTWLEKAMECSNAIQDLKINLGELTEQKFDNIQAEFDGLIGIIESLANIVDEQISGVEEKGYFVSESYYQELIKYEEDVLSRNKALLSQLKASLDEAVSTGAITEGSEAYNDMYQEILGVQQAIEESTNSIVEFNNTIRDIKWEIFDFLQERIQEITTETEFLINLIDNSSLFNDNGSLNSDGKSVIALHGINYNTYMEQAKQYVDELAKIESELAKDPANQDLIDRRKELLELQQEFITNAEAEKEAIKSIVEEGINIHLEALTELIEKYKESLNAAKD